MHEKLTLHQILLALGMLVTGSINSLSSKTQFQTKSKGLLDSDGKTFRPFNHAGIVTLIMFAGESLCLLGFCFSSRKVELSNKQLVIDQDSSDVIKQNRKTNRILHLIFILPAACDVIGSTLSALAMIHLDASVAQMLRGSIIVFTGILSSGLCLVGLASILKSESGNQSQKYVAIGVILTILSQIAGATQMVLEETFLKGKGFKPYHVVGMEGVYGFFLMSIVLVVMQYVPGPQPGNSFDNTYDALIMIKNSSTLTALSFVYLLSIAFFNYFGLSVTRSMTAVHRTFLDACRSVIIWLCSIIVYHSTNGKYGEKFDDDYGLLQIDGFLLLLIGTAIYNQLFDFSWIPCIKRIEYKIHSNEQHSKVINSDYEKCNAADNETNEHEEISPIYHGFLDD
ncbi:solute carrier family 35 member F6 isoform X2 [Hydra vulgaris]|uniref:solute carrier family 35 member F6 isoform X2 n=1 Tax=Hydra vulgaris TaxID=6087 RepID=UPI0032EA641E